MSDWKDAAAAHDPPSPYSWDVFLSHAGNRADKPFARALMELLQTCWPGVRVFLDDASLRPGADARAAMQAAIESTHVAVLLLSNEFFRRPATRGELDLLLDRHRLHRVQLLPVFLRLTVEDCQRELTALYGAGAQADTHCCDALGLGKCAGHVQRKVNILCGVHRTPKPAHWHSPPP